MQWAHCKQFYGFTIEMSRRICVSKVNITVCNDYRLSSGLRCLLRAASTSGLTVCEASSKEATIFSMKMTFRAALKVRPITGGSRSSSAARMGRNFLYTIVTTCLYGCQVPYSRGIFLNQAWTSHCQNCCAYSIRMML